MEINKCIVGYLIFYKKDQSKYILYVLEFVLDFCIIPVHTQKAWYRDSRVEPSYLSMVHCI